MGRGGGGRSSGGGGGRSSGGRSGGFSGGSRGGSRSGSSFGGSRGGSRGGSGLGSRPGSGFGGSRGTGSFGGPGFGGMGGFGMNPMGGRVRTNPTPSRPITNNGGFGMNNNRRNMPNGGGGGAPVPNGGGTGGCLSGCGLSITAIVVILVAVIFLFAACSVSFVSGSATDNEVTKSTVKREPLKSGVIETDYYTDEAGWIDDKSDLLPGLKHFYEKTGVQPYVYITKSINGNTEPTNTEIGEFAENLYDELFTDEAHFLLVFFQPYNDIENSEYVTWYVCGSQAKAVIDDEAADIILDYLDRYYYYDEDSLSNEEYLSKSFEEAADRIMKVTVSPWVYVWITLGVFAVAFLGYYWWKKAKEQKNKEDEATRKILETPLETFGETKTDVSDLEKKYQD